MFHIKLSGDQLINLNPELEFTKASLANLNLSGQSSLNQNRSISKNRLLNIQAKHIVNSSSDISNNFSHPHCSNRNLLNQTSFSHKNEFDRSFLKLQRLWVDADRK